MEMLKQRRTFDKDLKRMTIELTKSQENLIDPDKELDIRVELLYRRLQELLKKKGASFPGLGNVSLTPEQTNLK